MQLCTTGHSRGLCWSDIYGSILHNKEQLFDRAVMFRSQDTSARNSICLGSRTEERERSHPNLQVRSGPSVKSGKNCRECGWLSTFSCSVSMSVWACIKMHVSAVQDLCICFVSINRDLKVLPRIQFLYNTIICGVWDYHEITILWSTCTYTTVIPWCMNIVVMQHHIYISKNNVTISYHTEL